MQVSIFVILFPETFVSVVARLTECHREKVSCESGVPFIAADLEPLEAAIFCTGIDAYP